MSGANAAAEAAEAARLRAAIAAALAKQAALRAEREHAIEASHYLAHKTEEMGTLVVRDVKGVDDYIAAELLDVTSVMHELHDLSTRYFTYKNLATATRNLTKYTDQYATQYQFYNELRHIAMGVLVAIDAHLVSHEKARQTAERAYLANTEYWLSYALMAVILWWANEREDAERALSKALLFDTRKTALLLFFVNIRFDRKKAAAAWYRHYLKVIKADNVGEEFQYLLEGYLKGVFIRDTSIRRDIENYLDNLFEEIGLYNLNYSQHVEESAARYMEKSAHATSFEFFYLSEFCPEKDDLKDILSKAENNALVAQSLEKLAHEEDNTIDLGERIENVISDVVDSYDDEEEKLQNLILHNELIVAAKGDVTLAQQAYAERMELKKAVGYGDLLISWALTEDDPRIAPEVRKFAFRKLLPSIQSGFSAATQKYRARVKERYTISMKDWTMACHESDVQGAVSSYSQHFDKTHRFAYFSNKWILLWVALICVGLAGIIASLVVKPIAGVIVVSALLVVGAGFMLWRQIVSLQETLAQIKEKDIGRLHSILEELKQWRDAYTAADNEWASLENATNLLAD